MPWTGWGVVPATPYPTPLISGAQQDAIQGWMHTGGNCFCARMGSFQFIPAGCIHPGRP